jgi:hypothetical protein
MLTLATFTCAGGRQHQGVIQARSFAVVDSADQVRAVLGYDPATGASLRILSDSGTPRLTMGVAPDGSPFVGLFSEQGKARVMLASNEAGPGLHISEATGRPIASLFVNGAGAPSLILNNGPRGGVILTIQQPAGDVELALVDPLGKPRLNASLAADGETGLRFADERERTRLELKTTSDGTASVRSFDEHGQVLFSHP